MLHIIGLGTKKGELTLDAMEAIRRADAVFVRTAAHPAVQTLREAEIPFESLDALYASSRSYDTFVTKAVRAVRARARSGDVCYCADGGTFEDRVACVLAGEKGAEVFPGVSKSAAAAAKAGIAGSYTAVSATETDARELTRPLVVYDLADRALAVDVKLALAEQFGDEAPAVFVCGDKAERIFLYEADRMETYDTTCALVLPDEPLLEKKKFDLYDFLAVMRRLRAPDGCPWDRVQTHQSIRINCIEEAYELVDAIDADDPDKMCEEAGDVLMQAAFHTLMEEERGHFTMNDVITGLCRKLIDRHTHVFGQDKAAGADGALSVWEKNKMTEKHQTTYADAVNDVPAVFPALLRAQKIAKRTAKGGWKQTPEEARAGLRAAMDELFAKGESVLGAFLYAAAEYAYVTGGDCEQALLDEVRRRQAVYTAFEACVRRDGKDVNALSKEERDAYMGEAERAAQA